MLLWSIWFVDALIRAPANFSEDAMIGFVVMIRTLAAVDVTRLLVEVAARDWSTLVHGPSVVQIGLVGGGFFVAHEVGVLILAGRTMWRRGRGFRGVRALLGVEREESVGLSLRSR